MYSSPHRHVSSSSCAAVGQPCEDLLPTQDTSMQTRRQPSHRVFRVLLLACVGVALLCAPVATARSDDTTAAVRFDARYVVPEKAAVRENRLIGNFTSLVVDSLAWSTREGQDEVLDRLLGHPLASGTLAVIAPPPHEQTRYYSAATTPKAREAAAAKAAAAAAATTAGTSPGGHRAAAAGGTRQERDDSSAKLHIIYTKGVPMTTADGAAPEVAEGAGANSRLKKFVSPSLPLIGRTAETASVPSINEVWRDIRSRSLLNQLRTKVLGGSTAQSSDAAVLEDEELFHNQEIGNPSAMPLQQVAKTATRSATAAAGVTVDRVVQATETLIEVHQTKARVPVTLTADQVTVIAFDAFEGNTLSAVIQLPNWRYDSGVDSSNCYGLYLTAEVRANNPYGNGVRSLHATTTAAAAASATARDEEDWNDFFNEGYDYGTVTTSSTTRAPVNAENGEDDNEESFSSVWSSFAQMFDTSAFCEVKSSLGLRVSKVKATRTYYVVLKSWPQRYTPGMTDGHTATCRLDVFLDQTSAKQLKTLQIIFALAIPLLVVFVPLPFQLWRGDIIQSAMLDLDFADWMFYPPLLLRRKIVQGCVKLYESIKGCLTARRTARMQAELEARQRALADEMEAQFPTSGASQTQTAAAAATAADAPAGPPVRGWGVGAGGGGWGVPPTLLHQQQQQQSGDASASTSVHVPMATPPSTPHRALAGGTAVNRPLYSERQEQGTSTANSPLDPLLQAMEPAAAVSSSSTAAAAAAQPVTHQDTHNSSTTSRRSSGRVALGDSFAESADDDIRFASDANPRRRRALNAAVSAASRVGASDDVLIEAAEPSPAEEDGVSPLQTAQHAMTREEREAARSTSEHPSVNQAQQRQQQQQSSHMVQHELPETPEKKVKVTDGGKEGAEDDEEEEERFCRICREDGSEEPLVAPCSCTGSVRWVHRSCLDRWRIESTKRNLTNVNKCEICKHDFTIGISRMTLFWRSSQNIINGVLLFLTCFFAIFMIATLSHSTFGELSCVADYHNVAYKTMYMFEGITLSVFLYLLCVIVVLFAYLIVYSWFRSRPDVEAYIREAHVRPPFLTSRNVSMILLMSSTLTLQGLSLGYLIKYFLYSTSDIVWNWEASPLLGGMMFMLFMTVCLGFSVWLRDTVNRRRAAREGRVGQAEDVVIANPNDADGDANNNNNRNNTNGRQEQQGNGGGPRNGADGAAEHGAANPTETEVNGAAAAAASAAVPATATAPVMAPVVRGQAGDEDYTRQFAIPPEERVIRAFEYCPPRRTLPRAL